MLFIKHFSEVHCIALYADFKNEVQISPILKVLQGRKIKIVFPRVNKKKKTMEFVQVKNVALLKKSSYGHLEPSFRFKKIDLEDVDVIVIPGIVFDKKGYRLGYGKGYYDKTLNKMKKVKTIGLAFEFQVVPLLPQDPWDESVQMLITEKKVRIFKR